MQRAFIHKALRGNQNNKVIETDANGNIVYAEKAAASSGGVNMAVFGNVSGNATLFHTICPDKVTRDDGKHLIVTVGVGWAWVYVVTANTIQAPKVFGGLYQGSNMCYVPNRKELWYQRNSVASFGFMNPNTYVHTQFTVTGLDVAQTSGRMVYDSTNDLIWTFANNSNKLFAINASTRTLTHTITTTGYNIGDIWYCSAINRVIVAHAGSGGNEFFYGHCTNWFKQLYRVGYTFPSYRNRFYNSKTHFVNK
jgi:hypothetical protein